MTGCHETTRCIYRYIKDYITTHEYAPSLREISRDCYLGRSSVLVHLGKLEAWGCIERNPNIARGMRLGNDPRCKPKLQTEGAQDDETE